MIILFILHVSFVIVLLRFRLRMYGVNNNKKNHQRTYLYIAKLFHILRMKIERAHIITLNKFQFFRETEKSPNKEQIFNCCFGIEQEQNMSTETVSLS